MILILSEKNDSSTNSVIDWLKYNAMEFLRINYDDEIFFCFKNDDIGFRVQGQTIYLNNIKSYWYRRGDFSFFNKGIVDNQNNELFTKIKNHAICEINVLKEYIHFLLNSKQHINSYLNCELNKLVILNLAKKFGLDTPNWLFADLKSIESNKNKFITKVLSRGINFNFENLYLFAYTEELKNKKIDRNSDFSFPSFIQNKVEKKYELRIFFLDGLFFTMAIFSQLDKKTRTDFRRYNRERPNRNVPFLLPITIKNKIKKLMDFCNLNCGSIDIIVDTNNNYIFLEINPVGQFGMVSVPCNYFLEKNIANFLSQNKNEK
jgi:ATP-GRASP peptide maturase of grasp-with-spasm system